MLLIPTATNDGMKSRLFLPAHPGNQQGYLQEIPVMQYTRAQRLQNLTQSCGDQHALVVNVRIDFIKHMPDSFLVNNSADFPVKVI